MFFPTHEEVARIKEDIGIYQVGDWRALPNNSTTAQQSDLLELRIQDTDHLEMISEVSYDRDTERLVGQAVQADADARAANLAGQAEAARAESRAVAARSEAVALANQYRGNSAFNQRYRLMLQAHYRTLEMEEDNRSWMATVSLLQGRCETAHLDVGLDTCHFHGYP
jgi:hypothetical protein